jgi:hypothetical protein
MEETMAMILFQIPVTGIPFWESLRRPRLCIYKDFENILIKLKRKNNSLSELSSCVQFEDDDKKYNVANIYFTYKVLTILRIVSMIPFFLLWLIILIPVGSELYKDEVNIQLIMSILWYVFYFIEIIVLFLRYKSNVWTYLINMHPAYKNYDSLDIFICKYFLKK